MTEAAQPRRALVVGATGIVGHTLSAQLAEQGWQVTGLSRSRALDIPGVVSVQADLQEPEQLRTALMGVQPELVAITAWTRMDSEEENIRVNGGAVRNLLGALDPGPVKHVALMTGLKHYLGPFDNYATGVLPDTPFHEDEPRLDKPNFYYAQEDELFSGTERLGATWSVHRSHTIFGFATGNAMNMVLTLSAYATICREKGLPFVFPGSETQWNGVTDVTDAELLAEQIRWAAENEAGHNQAFNIANGDTFRWRWLWPQIAEHFGVEWEGFQDVPRPLAARMADAAPLWREIAAEHDLVEPDVDRIASWWHSDSDLGRNIECLTDMNKSRKAGFLGFRDSRDSFFRYVDRYRAAKILP
ncbi:SDR family oxidoreductase [Sinomonas soli]